MMTFHERYEEAAWFIILGLVFDSLDGHIARIFHNPTDFGRELDSLADLMTFVVAPCILVYRVIFYQTWPLLFLIVFLYLGTGAHRLARFNVQAPRKDSFEGLPSPAAAVTVAMSILVFEKYDCSQALSSAIFFVFVVMLVSFLMVSHIPYPKFSAMQFQGLRSSFFLILMAFIGVNLFFAKIHLRNGFEVSAMILFWLYVMISPVQYLFIEKRSFRGSENAKTEGTH